LIEKDGNNLSLSKTIPADTDLLLTSFQTQKPEDKARNKGKRRTVMDGRIGVYAFKKNPDTPKEFQQVTQGHA
jgi:hypothetical protein